jgi:predicted AAA+ superfamily ATPase
MIKRLALEKVEKGLARQAAVGLIGPRQVGKTTLALSLASLQKCVYLDLESRKDRDKLSDPELFLKMHDDKLVILDEIHRVPELFQALRGIIDKGRQDGKGRGRFLILGSASIDLLRQSGESLAGRIEYVEMNPLNVQEISPDDDALNKLWIRGGFPDSYLADDDDASFSFRRNFIRTYLERDVPQFGPRIPAESLERLWTMLAHNQGTLLNASKLAANLSVSAPTITTYIDLLVDLLLVRRLMPFHMNIGKRLVKSPKTYVRDSGLLHALLSIEDANELAGHPIVGASWEGLVIETLLSVAPERVKASFYRTAAGAEMDLVLDLGGKHGRWAIEIKRSLYGKPGKGFYQALGDLKPERAFVVYAGQERYPIAEGIEVISLKTMASILQSL